MSSRITELVDSLSRMEVPSSSNASNGVPTQISVAGNIAKDHAIQINHLTLQHVGDKTKDILSWLSTIEYGAHHERAFEGTALGTCRWLFENEKYLEWRNLHASSILWLRGDPGVGKTKLTAAIVQELRGSQCGGRAVSQNAVAYFYCDRAERTRNDPREIFCSLLKQLSLYSAGTDDASTPTLQRAVFDDYVKRKNEGFPSGKPSPSNCVALMRDFLGSYAQTIIIIDALDEVGFEDRNIVLKELQKLIEIPNCRMKIFVSGRPEDDIIRHFENNDVKFHYIQPSDNSKDIEVFVNQQLDIHIRERRLLGGKVDDVTKSLIFQSLVDKAQGMFLWVRLQLEHLCEQPNESFIVEALRRLPIGLRNTYDLIYSRILQKERTKLWTALSVIQWTLQAARPLSVEELVGAVHRSLVDGIGNEARNFEAPTLEFIITTCHNLLVLDQQEGVVRFVHLSTREYLENHCWTAHNREYLERGHSITQSHVQALVLKSCLRALMNPNLRSDLLEKDFTNYAIHRWPKHLRSRSLAHQETLRGKPEYREDEERELIETFLGTHKKPGKYFARALDLGASVVDFQRFRSEPQTPIFVASYCGMEAYVRDKCIPDLVTQSVWSGGRESCIDILNNCRETALQLASRKGHIALASLLIHYGAKIDGVDVTYRTPLSEATRNGNIKVMQFLLDNGADINYSGRNNYTPLSLAALEGKVEAVRFLLQNGADINPAASKNKKTPLLSALSAHNLEPEVVRFLVENGADVNAAIEQSGMTPLIMAAYKGHAGIIEYLIKKGANISKTDRRGDNPLHWAIQEAKANTVQALIRNGANVNAENNLGLNPLQLAATTTSIETVVEIMKHLLENGAFVDSCTKKEKRTALQLACAKRHHSLEVVQFLLEKRADINAGSGDATPLGLAARRGEFEIVRFLVSRGADINAAGKGEAPLVGASYPGNLMMVRFLLEHGADINAGVGQSGTALAAASWEGNLEVVRYLIDQGSHLNAMDMNGNTPLSEATSTGNMDVVKILLERGADVNATGDSGRKLLQKAKRRGDHELVGLLLENGATKGEYTAIFRSLET